MGVAGVAPPQGVALGQDEGQGTPPEVGIREAWRILRAPKERRLVVGLLSHWMELREARDLPLFRSLNPERLPAEWRHCCLVSVDAETVEPAWEYVGETFAEECGRILTQEALSAAPPDSLLGQTARLVSLALTRRTAVTSGGSLRRAAYGLALFRAIALPFVDERDRVDYILGAANCRRVVEPWSDAQEPVRVYTFDRARWEFAPICGDEA